MNPYALRIDDNSKGIFTIYDTANGYVVEHNGVTKCIPKELAKEIDAMRMLLQQHSTTVLEEKEVE